MNLMILGSIAIDSVKTPFAEAENLPGGSAIYASMASSYFISPQIVGVVGMDFKKEWLAILKKRKIDISGIEVRKGKTFRWKGVYNDFNKAITLDTKLNVFKDFSPELSDLHLHSDYVLLGNIDPTLQFEVLTKIKNVNKKSFIAIDTMNFWVNSKRDKLIDVIKKSNLLFLNEDEAKLLAETDNIFKSIDIISDYFKGTIVIKRGEYGAFIFKKGKYFFSPAYPVKDVFDTTGAGDSFAGAFMGFLAQNGVYEFNFLKKALLYGVVSASFVIESFSVYKMLEISINDLRKRYKHLTDIIKL